MGGGGGGVNLNPTVNRSPSPNSGMQSLTNPRSPGTYIVGPWVVDSTNLYRDLRTGTQYVGKWASRETASTFGGAAASPHQGSPSNVQVHRFSVLDRYSR